MRILWVKANKILPVHSGGDLRSFNLLRELAAREEVIFFSYYDGAPDAAYEQELQKQLPGAICVCTGKKQDSSVARGFDYVLKLADSAPYAVSRFAAGKVRERLRKCLTEDRPDVVVCDFLDAAVNFPEELQAPAVLFQHNVESEIWRRHAETSTNPARRQIYKMEFGKMLRYEQKMVKKFDHVIAVSEHDRSLMSAWTDSSRISVVPTGVDLSRFQGQDTPLSISASESNPVVMFVGAMDWPPNVDGVEYFCSEIWPGVRAKVPGAQFRVVGRNPERRIQKLASDSITVTGSVPSVVEHLREAAVVIVPLRIGGGTRLKIYEAMAAGKAVVSTTIGAEGLDVHHGKDIWLADDAAAFTDAVAGLLQDQKMRERFEQAAAALAAQYDWSAVAGKFHQVLQAAISPAAVAENVTQLATAG
jgi:polysaccharide biosynthesis protein PslH